MQNVDTLNAMGKLELRSTCKEFGVKGYGKMDNAKMREAVLLAQAMGILATKVPAEVEDCSAEHGEQNTCEKCAVEEVAEPKKEEPNMWTGMLSPVAPVIPKGAVTRVVDGKKVEARSPKAKGESRPRVEKDPAPIVPRVSIKGYVIQKEREERNGVKRPSEGTVCGAVWHEFDLNPKIAAGDLQGLADANGWNRTNVSCEFYAWRKFMGIKGRSSK